jgi:hypothetical protein
VDDSKDNVFSKAIQCVSSGFSWHWSHWPARGIFKNKSNTTASWTERCGGAVRCWRRSGAFSKFNARRIKASGRTRRWQRKGSRQRWREEINIVGGFPESVQLAGKGNTTFGKGNTTFGTDISPSSGVSRHRSTGGRQERFNAEKSRSIFSGVSRHRSTDGRQERFDAGKSMSTFSGVSRYRSTNGRQERFNAGKRQFHILGEFPASVRSSWQRNGATLERAIQHRREFSGIGPIRPAGSGATLERTTQHRREYPGIGPIRPVEGGVALEGTTQHRRKFPASVRLAGRSIQRWQGQSRGKSTLRAMQRQRDRFGIVPSGRVGGEQCSAGAIVCDRAFWAGGW